MIDAVIHSGAPRVTREYRKGAIRRALSIFMDDKGSEGKEVGHGKRSEEGRGRLCMRGRAEEIEGREWINRDKWRHVNVYE